jgi:hypothetical protein
MGTAPRMLVTADRVVLDAAARAGVDDRVRGM